MSKRALFVAFFGIPIIVVIAVVFAHRSNDAAYGRSNASYEMSQLQSAALSRVYGVFTGTPSFARKIVASSTIGAVEKRIDACDGPVAVPLGSTVLVAEHDYCGGSNWIGRLKSGQAVVLSGPDLIAGTYVADELRYRLRGKAKVSDLPPGDIVLQTCVSKTKLVLIGLYRVVRP